MAWLTIGPFFAYRNNGTSYLARLIFKKSDMYSHYFFVLMSQMDMVYQRQELRFVLKLDNCYL